MIIMNPIYAWIRIIRPPIVLISCLGVSVGALNVTIGLGNPINYTLLLYTLLSASLLSSGLMVHNDYTDLSSDRINRPNKPIPSGAISPSIAHAVGIVLMVLSTVISFIIGLYTGIVALSIIVVGFVYNYKGKYTGFWGHMMVAYGVAMIPYYGAIAMGDSWRMIPLALSIFVMEIGREIVVCVGDYEGDLKSGFRTLPVILGQKKSMHIALLFYSGFIPIYPLSYILKIFGGLYIFGATIFIIGLFITWYLAYREMNWEDFERYIRTGTRLFVIFFEFILLLEAFY